MAEADDTTEAPEPPPLRLGMMQIVMIVVLVAITQAGVMLVMETMRPPAVAPGDEAGAEAAEVPVVFEPANYLPLNPALVVNFDDAGQSRFLQTSVQVMTRDKDLYEEARNHTPAMRNSLLMLLGTVDYESVTTRAGKEALQQRALTTVDDALFQVTGKRGLDALYFTDFVVQ